MSEDKRRREVLRLVPESPLRLVPLEPEPDIKPVSERELEEQGQETFLPPSAA